MAHSIAAAAGSAANAPPSIAGQPSQCPWIN